MRTRDSPDDFGAFETVVRAAHPTQGAVALFERIARTHDQRANLL